MNQSQKSRQMSETFQLGILLAGIGGFLDAYTYICRGGVFANAQTGNIVLLGMRLAERNPMAAVRYVIPILAFVAGVVVAEWIKNKYKNTAKIHWRQIIILIECLVLLGVAFLPQTNEFNLLANVMISFVCSLQVESFRKMNGHAFATTMCTGNLRSATECLYKSVALKSKEELRRGLEYLGIIAFFIVGATLGAVLTTVFGIAALFAACIGLLIVFGLMFIECL